MVSGQSGKYMYLLVQSVQHYCSKAVPLTELLAYTRNLIDDQMML